MGNALITDNLTKGRYTVRLDFGDAARNQQVAQRNAIILSLNARLSKAIIAQADAQTLYDGAVAALDAFIADWSASGFPAIPGTPNGKEHEQLLKASTFYGAQLQRAKSSVNALKLSIAKQQKAVTALQDLPLVQTRQVWCTDFTEDATGLVGTAEIPGEQDHILIKPGAPAWRQTDGVLVAREVMDPNLAYFNAAILPGWQKYKPTFRAGTILELNTDQDKATVELNPYTSSAQRLPVNQQSVLTGIPVTYMTCNAAAFAVGDRVVVMFDNQDQSQPRVIGFVDNPKSCNWPCFYAGGGFAYFGSKITAIFDSMLSGGATTARIRFDGGAWVNMNLVISTATQLQFREPLPGSGVFGFTTLIVQRLSSEFNGYKDSVALATSPFFPETTTRRIAEAAIYDNGKLVFNAAATDFGLAGSANYKSGGVKAPGGITITDPLSDVVFPLAYTLTAQ